MYQCSVLQFRVLALKSENGFGVGEFPDLKILADWAKKTNLFYFADFTTNDTTANYT